MSGRRVSRRRSSSGAALGVVGVVAGIAGLGAVLAGYTPQPEVSAAGSNALLGLNARLLDVGTAAVIGVAALGLLWGVGQLTSARLREIHRMTAAPGDRKGVARLLLAPLLIATVAMGTSLGDEAGRGAREPVEQLVDELGAEPHDVRVLLQHEGSLPFNHAAMPAALLVDAPPGVVPVDLRLGSASVPGRAVNPSSAAIVAVPDALWSAMGLSFAGGSVVTTRQFADVGTRLLVGGDEATVVRTVDWFPGLDRTAILLRAADPAFDEGIDAFSAALLVDDEAERWARSVAVATNGEVTSLDAWLDDYDTFWGRSVSPLSMEYLLALLLVGAVASAFIRGSDILRRRRQLAVQHVLGVTRRVLIAAELHRAAFDTVVATLVATPLYLGLIAVTNSSQFGVSIALSPSALGAGALLVGASMMLSVASAARMITRMDTAHEVR